MSIPAPFTSQPYMIEPQWIDYNGHFNMAYYNVLFDRDSDRVLSLLGLGPAYIRKTGNSYFTLEAHVTYLRELRPEHQVKIDTQFLDCDKKRLHYVQTMRHATEAWIACISENMVMHINMTAKKSSPFPDDILEKLSAAHLAHAALPIPSQVGHQIGIPKIR